jgi:hypothetical protein
VMQCPNCRNIEKGHWLYGNESQPCSHSDTGDWLNGETFDYVSNCQKMNYFACNGNLGYL